MPFKAVHILFIFFRCRTRCFGSRLICSLHIVNIANNRGYSICPVLTSDSLKKVCLLHVTKLVIHVGNANKNIICRFEIAVILKNIYLTMSKIENLALHLCKVFNITINLFAEVFKFTFCTTKSHAYNFKRVTSTFWVLSNLDSTSNQSSSLFN